MSESVAYPALLNALNSSEILSCTSGFNSLVLYVFTFSQKVCAASDETIDLYSLLVTLPKHTDGESNAANDSLEVQEISKKEQGRMKAKRAREAVAQKRASEAGAASNSPADERDSKKTKSEP